MPITRDNEEVLVNAITFFVENTRNCKKVKLLKLLYQFDFIHYKQTGFSATGMQYQAWENGPVSPELFAQIFPNSFSRNTLIRDHFEIKVAEGQFGFSITPRQAFDPAKLTDRQHQILQVLAEEYRDSDAEIMIESTHLPNRPWHRTYNEKRLNNVIDYDLAVDDSPDSLPLEVIKDRQREAQEVYAFFNV